MPQKHGRLGKHLGWDDLAAMEVDELLEHLETWYDVVDIKIQDTDITHVHEPPITTKGDPYMRNCLVNKKRDNIYGKDRRSGVFEDLTSQHTGSVMRHLTRREIIHTISELQGGGGW
tara:strand:+ start:253 stop:603 length:351 start_codon:yes stop_codon:yes gene_type:complete